MRGIPRNHYLLVHDALRKVCASSSLVCPPPKLAAFVNQRHPFQCDMLINSQVTDPDNFQPAIKGLSGPISSSSSSPTGASTCTRSSSPPSRKGGVKAYHAFLYALQKELGLCHVHAGPHIARVDIRFADQSVIHLALGAALEDLPSVHFPDSCSPATPGTSIKWSSPDLQAAAAAAVNGEPSRLRRARLRVSLGGYDEALFIESISGIEKLAARKLCDWTHDYALRTPTVWSTHPITRVAPPSASARDLLLPPHYYWLAHAKEAMSQFSSSVKNHMDLMRIIQSHFISVFDGLPLENPFFPGEDLNTLPEVQWWGLLFQAPAEAAKRHHRIASSFSPSASARPVGAAADGSSSAAARTDEKWQSTHEDGVVELNLSSGKVIERKS